MLQCKTYNLTTRFTRNRPEIGALVRSRRLPLNCSPDVKLQPDRIDSANVIGAHGPDGVTINGRAYPASVVVPSKGNVIDWSCRRIEDLRAEHFEQVARLAPEVVLFGSGARLRFAAPEALRPLIERGIGVETMDTGAACRTYNILVSEGRTVVAALLIES